VSTFYEQIGRLVVAFVRWRYGKQLRIAAGVALAALAVGGYLIASREPPEG
jgi:hypothetical protein